ncbi:phage integrase family protein [Pseudonocardia hierapolitana]|uniref:Phage integrase family protein n=1 Tax=Pseudonocardia hierapolitana TaxID=1128676 RepID=A0A561SSB7_9PSEU|nr:site-specific integrase [Pseudonocardia hierapolitana]TWF77764.1 phage integrase family protein [Pseudonocardia hierapolitana]
MHYIHRVLALALKYAVLDGRLSRNPAAGVPLPRATARPKVFLTHAQVQQLADECGEYATPIYVLGYIGLRWGEVAALRVRDVDLMRRRRHIEQAMAEVKGRAELGTPKDHERRSVPIPEFLLTDLEKAIAARGHRPDDLLFPAPEGGFLRNGNFRKRVFDAAAKRAGIVGVTPHGLRHTAASLAVQAGASVLAVCRMLGHSSPKVTLEVYAKLFDDDLDTLASRLHTATITSDADQVRTNRRVIMLPERAASGRDAV